MGAKFDFSEDEISEMYKMYERVLEEVQELTKEVVEQISSKARELKYKQIIELAKEAVSYYNEELKSAEAKALQEWQSGEASFTSIMKKMSAGEEAESRSSQLEANIEEEIQSWKALDSAQFTGIDTTNWTCKESDFEQIQQIVEQYSSKLEGLREQSASSIKSRMEENAIYNAIYPVIVQSITIVKDGFQVAISEIYGELAQDFASRSSEVMARGMNAAQSVASKSQSLVSSGVSGLKAKVKQILE